MVPDNLSIFFNCIYWLFHRFIWLYGTTLNDFIEVLELNTQGIKNYCSQYVIFLLPVLILGKHNLPIKYLSVD